MRITRLCAISFLTGKLHYFQITKKYRLEEILLTFNKQVINNQTFRSINRKRVFFLFLSIEYFLRHRHVRYISRNRVVCSTKWCTYFLKKTDIRQVKKWNLLDANLLTSGTKCFLNDSSSQRQLSAARESSTFSAVCTYGSSSTTSALGRLMSSRKDWLLRIRLKMTGMMPIVTGVGARRASRESLLQNAY